MKDVLTKAVNTELTKRNTMFNMENDPLWDTVIDIKKEQKCVCAYACV